jgi:hypothetical protein
VAAVFVSLDGLSITPVQISATNDAVAQRSWIENGDALCDSGWLL